MKKKFPFLLLIVFLSCIAIAGFAQDEEEQPFVPATPKWVSEKGYWQVENNIKIPKVSIITFYTNEGALIYKEKVEGVKMKLTRRKVLMCLKRALEQAIDAWGQKHMLKTSQALVATALKR